MLPWTERGVLSSGKACRPAGMATHPQSRGIAGARGLGPPCFLGCRQAWAEQCRELCTHTDSFSSLVPRVGLTQCRPPPLELFYLWARSGVVARCTRLAPLTMALTFIEHLLRTAR